MISSRRTLLLGGGAALTLALSTPRPSWAKGTGPTVFYATVGTDIHLYSVDPAAMTLTHQGVTKAPEAVQYIWVHPRLPVLYASYSNRFSTKLNNNHGVAAFHIDRTSGTLTPFGANLRLDTRPINTTVDPAGHFLLNAANDPASLFVNRLGPDGAIGAAVVQKAQIDGGIYAHQVRVSPDGRLVVLVTRGNDPTPTAKADPGALKVFHFRDGQLGDEVSLTEGDGRDFGPRHVDFHPTKPWMFVSMERNNQMLTYGLTRAGLTPAPLFTRDTVRQGASERAPVQYVGPIHVAPNGRFVYLCNRSDSLVDFNGHKIHGAGENTVAVFRVNEHSGEPTLIQTIDTQSFHCRTFSIHPDGKMLVTAAVETLDVRNGDAVKTVPAALSVFSVAADGRLAFVRKYDVDIGNDAMFWCGMVRL